MNIRRTIVMGAAIGCAVTGAQADVKVTSLFSDGMVLQREIAAPVWGTSDAGEAVTVKIGEAQATAQADASGRWMAKLPPQKANATPQELVISGKNTLTIKNVLVGDVWVCSGQSNMEWSMNGSNAGPDIAAANHPTLRRIKFEHRALGRPTTEVPGRWDVCTPGSAGGFTAVGFFFARRVQKETGLPIGLIDTNWGGTRIEPWIPPSAFESEAGLANIAADMKRRSQDYRNGVKNALDPLEKWVAAARTAVATPDGEIPPMPNVPKLPGQDESGYPSAIYNGQIFPLLPYAIKGALWYQGESNGGEGDEYFLKMRALITGWRKVWNQGDFPFYHVQLANYQAANDNPAGGDGWAKLRMAQLKSLQIPKTGMAVIIDIGEANDIHPRNKFDVGERLARWALRDEYGQDKLVVSGPLYRGMKVEDGKIRLEFDHVGTGLMVGKKDGRNPTVEAAGAKLKRFAIAGEDKVWVWADAIIEGGNIVVSSPQVPKPVAVRYAYSMNPDGANLYNREGLPASPFRTDAW